MLYSNYEKKIQKLQRILTRIHKFRFLIIAIIGVLLAVSVSLMIIKGTFSSDLAISSSQIVYGEDYTYEANAIMGGVQYEFYDCSTDQWQSEKPYKVGSYKVRAKSTRVFGGTEYSNVVDFEITPRVTDVLVGEQSLIYGGVPTIVVSLAYGDKVDDYTYILNTINVGEQSVVIENIRVVDADGYEVNSCYEFNFIEKRISVTQKNLDITFLGGEKIYDGLPLSNDKYTVVGLEYGDRIEILSCPQIVDVGEIENTIDFTILNENGDVVKDNYNINVDAEKLCVTKRTISIKPKDEIKVYDAQPLVANRVELTHGELISSHYFDNVVFAGVITDCGEVTSKITSMSIFDGDQNDVTDNYDITLQTGLLKVTKCSIEVSASAEKVYDATSNVDKDVFTSINSSIVRYDGNIGLFDGQKIELEFVQNEDAIDVGEYVLEIKEYSIKTNDGVDVTHNYDVTLLDGTLEITKCGIEIDVSAQKVYDATNNIDEEKFTYFNLSIVRYDGSIGLFDGQEIEYELVSDVDAIDVGYYLLKLEEWPVITDGGRDITHNYDITLIDGILEITPCGVDISVSAQKVYDATSNIDIAVLTSQSLSIVRHDGSIGLFDGHTIEYELVADLNAIEVGEYPLSIKEWPVIMDRGRDVTYNYDINLIDGILEITKCSVEISADAKKVYDATSRVDESTINELSLYVLRYDGGYELFNGQTITLNFVENSNAIEVGEYPLSIKELTIMDHGRDVTHNYDITLIDGTLEITKCYIEVTASAEKEYDATSNVDASILSNVNIFIYRYDGSVGLFDGHTIECEFEEVVDAIEVGEYPLFIKEWPVITHDGRDVTHNYDITLFDGILRIKPRVVSIVTESKTKEYDRTALSCESYDIVGGSLVATHGLVITATTPSITEVGSVENIFEFDVVDGNGDSVYTNYEIRQTPGTLTITKRKMEIFLYEVKKIYDSESAVIDDRYWTTKNNLLEGDTISGFSDFIVSDVNNYQVELGSITSAGTYTVTAQCLIDYAESYTDYYDIQVVGQIIIEKAEIIIASNSASKVYDGSTLSDDGYIIISGKIGAWDMLTVQNTGSQTEIGSSPNTISEIYVNDQLLIIEGDGVYEAENYIIKVKEGVLTVTES